jgi:hypothetical protein
MLYQYVKGIGAVIGAAGFIWMVNLDSEVKTFPLSPDPLHGNIYPLHVWRGGADHFVSANLNNYFHYGIAAFMAGVLIVGLGSYLQGQPKRQPGSPPSAP